MREEKYYACKYCFKEFEPRRRRVQKYCCDSCRSKAYHARKVKNTQLTKTSKSKNEFEIPNFPTAPKKLKIDTMSASGVGNAVLGTFVADSLKSLVTKEQNKPVTKGDLENLTYKLVKRYHPVINLPKRYDGALPYFDIKINQVVYSFFHLDKGLKR